MADFLRETVKALLKCRSAPSTASCFSSLVYLNLDEYLATETCMAQKACP